MKDGETYKKWKQELERRGRTPSDAVAWCGEQELPANYVEYLETFISKMEAPKQSAEYSVHILTGLLHYHERMTMGVAEATGADGASVTIQGGTLYTGYAEALREAIRCIKEVHGME